MEGARVDFAKCHGGAKGGFVASVKACKSQQEACWPDSAAWICLAIFISSKCCVRGQHPEMLSLLKYQLAG